MSGQVVTGLFTVLGVVVGLFGERWVRTWGEVHCEVLDWRVTVGTAGVPEERRLEVRFVNGKEVPLIVLEMQVEFSKGDKPLEAWARPTLQVVDETSSLKSPLSPVNLPPRAAVTRTFSLIAGRDDIRQELAATDGAKFVASFIGARDKRVDLPSPWSSAI